MELATIWRESDAVSLHCPLTPESREMVNARTLQACKRGVLLVNTARGGLIDEAALLETIRSGRLAAAGLDSFAVKPMTSNAVPPPAAARPGDGAAVDGAQVQSRRSGFS